MFDTYYTVLGVPEKATPEEIKKAYKILIKQVHPDAVPNASPYWKQAAEEKSREVTEAYRVLSNSVQRSLYDKNLADLRRASAPPPQQPVPPQSPAQPQSQSPPNTQPSSAPTRQKGYNWTPLREWTGKHPLLVIVSVLFTALAFIAIFSNDTTPSSSSVASQGAAGPAGTQDKSEAQIASDYAARIRTQEPTPANKPTATQEPTPPKSTIPRATGQHENVPVTVVWAMAHGLNADVKTKEQFCAAGLNRESPGTSEQEELYCASPLLYWEDVFKTETPSVSPEDVEEVPSKRARTTVTSFGVVEGPCCTLVVISDYSRLEKRCAFGAGTFPCGVGEDEEIAVLHKGDFLTLLEPVCKRTPDGRHACRVRMNEGKWVGYVDETQVQLVENN